MSRPQRNAIVTGAAQGIGQRTAELLTEQGYALLLSDQRPPEETAQAIRERGGEALEFTGDISDEDTVARLGQFVEQHWDHVDLLVNNAGISCISPAEQVPIADIRRVLAVNLVAPFMLAQLFGRTMLAHRSGSIVNVASIAGLVGVADRAAYNASKHGLIGLTRTLAAEWGGRGVRVNAVCPGWIKTEMDVADQSSGAYSDADIVNRLPMARFASPQDVANAIAFLADGSLSGFINGVSLPVDGGWTADGSWDSLRIKTRP